MLQPNSIKNPNMKKLSFFALLLIISSSAFSSTYYFSSVYGNDSLTYQQAQHSNTPWRSLSKLNSYSTALHPGDSILFKRGETWYGSIRVNNSGTASLPIFIGAFGTGPKPVITGFQKITSWGATNPYASAAMSFTPQSPPNIVAVNGIAQQIGRWPNATVTNKGYLTYEASGSTYVTDNNWSAIVSQSDTSNWTGAEIVLRANRYRAHTSLITSQTYSGSATTFNFLDPFSLPSNGYGYFIQNHIKTLDQPGEWYYNTSNRVMNIYLNSAPANYTIEVPTLDTLIYNYSNSFITYDNLAITGANRFGINIQHGSDMIIQNCDIYNIGTIGVYIRFCDNSVFNNNTINYCMSEGFKNQQSNNITVTNNIITNIMPFMGMQANGGSNGTALYAYHSSGLVQYNTVRNSGYCGIWFDGRSNTTIKNNIVDSALTKLDDGGGIYTVNKDSTPYTAYTNRVVQQNIVTNCTGAPEGAIGGSAGEGLYGDKGSRDIVWDGNIASNCTDGFFMNDPSNMVLKNNLIYGVTNRSLWMSEYTANLIRNMTIVHNIFFTTNTTGKSMNFDTSITHTYDIGSYGMIDSNYYVRPKTSQPYIFRKTFPEWRIAFPQYDAHSAISPLIPDSVFRLVYNSSKTTATYSLDGLSYVSSDGKKYSQSVTLQPFTAVALMIDINNVSLSPIADAYVRNGSYATTNYGFDSNLVVKSVKDSVAELGYKRTAYLKFSLKNVKEVGSAKLRVFAHTVVNAANPILSIFGVNNDTWTESGITYNNAPPSSTSALNSINIVGTNRYYEFDVTNYVKTQAAGDTLVSFVLTDTSNQQNYLSFNSKESSQNLPQLVIVAPATIKPSDDAYVRDGSYAAINYVTDTSLVVKKAGSGYSRKSYLKFSLNSIGNVKSAKLRLYGSNEDATNVKLSVYGVNNDLWADTTITWNNAPGSITALLDSETVNNVAKYYEFDVTNFVKSEFSGDKTVSFVIKDTIGFNKVVTFNSSRNLQFPPQLVVDYSGDTTTTSQTSINGIPITKRNVQQEILNNRNSSLKIRVYPNPVNNQLHFTFPDTYEGNYNLQIVDIAGRIYDLGRYNINASGYNVNADISRLSLRAGQYFIRISSEKQSTQVIKLIVK